jgi:Cu(I)/Ag(I) efflux system membrane protein CusA/SilA
MIEVSMIMGTLPLAMVGGIGLMAIEGYHFSVAVGVGFIALAGVAVEIGVIMLVYLNQSYQALLKSHLSLSRNLQKEDIFHAVLQGAGMRIRPVMMTATAIIAGLLPILYGSGTGSEVMSRIAVPMVGGMITSLFLTLLVLPTLFYVWRSYKFS